MAENTLVLLSPVGGKPDVVFDGTCFLLAVDRWRGAGVAPGVSVASSAAEPWLIRNMPWA
jgi:hypothetical protein